MSTFDKRDDVIGLFSLEENTHRLEHWSGMWYGLDSEDNTADSVDAALARAKRDLEAEHEFAIDVTSFEHTGHTSGQFVHAESRIGLYYWKVMSRVEMRELEGDETMVPEPAPEPSLEDQASDLSIDLMAAAGARDPEQPGVGEAQGNLYRALVAYPALMDVLARSLKEA